MSRFKPTDDTAYNYDLLAQAISEQRLSGVAVLDLLTNYHGLKLLDKQATSDLLEELGYDIDEEEED